MKQVVAMSTALSFAKVPAHLPQAAPITCVQPNGGWIVRLELFWGRCRRWLLRRCWPGYVRRMQDLRQGSCTQCPHDIIDARDLKLYRNVCGYWFETSDDPYRWRDRLPICRMGLAEVVVFGSVLVLLALLLGLLWPWLAALPILPLLFLIAFFRDPPRRAPTEAGLFVAPADGRVTDIEMLDWQDDLEGPAVKIGIYLSVFNVHVNRCPVAARVVSVRYFPGQFLDVRHRDAPRINEQLWLLLETETSPSHRVLVKPIAGAFARRIVTEVRPGQVLDRGARIGMIKFGSRTELYLPHHAGLHVLVKPGDRVRGGMTVVARELESS